jgi:predicted nucleotide-binding protein (sugar kinase/HSP70/actin superfamily)
MPLPVNLQDIVAEMDALSDEHKAYINRKSDEEASLAGFRFRAEALEQIASDFLEVNGVPYTPARTPAE